MNKNLWTNKVVPEAKLNFIEFVNTKFSFLQKKYNKNTTSIADRIAIFVTLKIRIY